MQLEQQDNEGEQQTQGLSSPTRVSLDQVDKMNIPIVNCRMSSADR